jgi:hypothetical protein
VVKLVVTDRIDARHQRWSPLSLRDSHLAVYHLKPSALAPGEIDRVRLPMLLLERFRGIRQLFRFIPFFSCSYANCQFAPERRLPLPFCLQIQLSDLIASLVRNV